MTEGGCNESMDGRQKKIYIGETVGLMLMEISAPLTKVLKQRFDSLLSPHEHS